MADRIAPAMRAMQVCSPLPDDVMPNIMLRVEHRQDFARLACTCRGFYAWSEPWLKSRRQAAELNNDPQRLIKLPAWIKTHSRHLHPDDWDALQRWTIDDEKWAYPSQVKRKHAFLDTIRLQMGAAPLATKTNAAHLDFILFSPRLLPDVNQDAASGADARAVANACFALAGFLPSGEAWQYDVLAGATAWLKDNTEKLSLLARSHLHSDLVRAMTSIMTAQRSPRLATHLLEYGLLKSHDVSDGDWHVMFERRVKRDALLAALPKAGYYTRPEAGSPEASAFLSAIHQVILMLAQMKENEALSAHVSDIFDVMALIPERTWTPGSPGTAYLHSLAQAVKNLPDALGRLGNALIRQKFIMPEGWGELVLSLQDTSG